MIRNASASLLILLLATGCGNVSQHELKERWDDRNAPERMGFDQLTRTYKYTSKFDSLPIEGRLNKKPWADDYWPTYKGGISYRWNDRSVNSDVKRYGYQMPSAESIERMDLRKLSPAEKYDIFIGALDFPLTRYERERTKILKTIPSSSDYTPGFAIPTWEGICHGLMPASLFYSNPKPVTLQGAEGHQVPFGSSDIKALLSFFLHYDNSGQSYFLGGRCNLNFNDLQKQLQRGEISQSQYLAALTSAECRDSNAGAFHIVLANQIGLMDEGFIVDITRDQEVWNQSVFGFKSKVLGQHGPTRGAAPGTVKEIEIETAMDYSVEIQPTWDRVDTRQSEARAVYRYRVELNEAGEIIGGAWQDSTTAKSDRPDFLWKQTVPEFSGFFEPLKEIYKASAE